MAFVWDFRYDDTHFSLPSGRANAIIIIKIKLKRKSLSVHWALQSLCAHRGEAEWNLLPNWANRQIDDKRADFEYIKSVWAERMSICVCFYVSCLPKCFSRFFWRFAAKIIQMIFISASRFLLKILFLRIKIYETANRVRYKCTDADT